MDYCPNCHDDVEVEESEQGARVVERCGRCGLRLNVRLSEPSGEVLARLDGPPPARRARSSTPPPIERRWFPDHVPLPRRPTPAGALGPAGATPRPLESGNVSLFAVGDALREMGQYDQAVRVLTRVAAAPASRAEAQHAIGLCHLEQADFCRAAECFGEALAAPMVTDEVRACILYDLATVHEAQGEGDGARACLQEILDTHRGDLLDVKARLDRLR